MKPEQLIFLDLETTGISPQHERIIEIGLCEAVDGEVVAEWSTLIDPGKPIAPFIERLTGISSAMVSGAPAFAAIAGELQQRLAGKILVAHNARFDYGFLQSEFERLGLAFQARTLCTVKLSRSLYPQHGKHNLDALIARHELACDDRHRALGDAKVLVGFLATVARQFPPEIVDQAIDAQLKQPGLPPHLAREDIEVLPHSAGIYKFYGENESLLYVGKSVDIRSRVRSHFGGGRKGNKGMRLSRQIRRIDWQETAGELGALLLEARLVKQLRPIHNRRLKSSHDLFSLRLLPGKNGTSRPEIVALKGEVVTGLDCLFGLFRTRREADSCLRRIIRDQGLCRRLLGLEPGSGACFDYQIKQCRGACVGLEPLPLHEARLVNAVAGMRMRSWPFKGRIGIRERSSLSDRTDIHVFDRWCHLGTADSEHRLHEILACPDPLIFDLDIYKILTRWLARKNRRPDLIDFPCPAYEEPLELVSP